MKIKITKVEHPIDGLIGACARVYYQATVGKDVLKGRVLVYRSDDAWEVVKAEVTKIINTNSVVASLKSLEGVEKEL